MTRYRTALSASACAVALVLRYCQAYDEVSDSATCRQSAFDQVNSLEPSRQKPCLLQSGSALQGQYLEEAELEGKPVSRHGSTAKREHPKASAKSAAQSREKTKEAPPQGDYVDATEVEPNTDLEETADADVSMSDVSPKKQDPLPGNGTKKDDDALEPDHSDCNPACTWKCVTPKCDQVCEPTCMPPKCETRCAALNTSGCVMDCQEPTCYTVCPKNMCAGKKCPTCKTTCSKPCCRLKCPQRQNCKSICATPTCEWHCSKPAICPAPKCKLECEQPTKCKGGIHEKLPDLKAGEFKVGTFEAPLNLYPSVEESGSGMEVVPTTGSCSCTATVLPPCCKEGKKVADSDSDFEVVSNTQTTSSDADGYYYSGAEAGEPVTMPVTVERSAQEVNYPQSHKVQMPVLLQKAGGKIRRFRE